MCAIKKHFLSGEYTFFFSQKQKEKTMASIEDLNQSIQELEQTLSLFQTLDDYPFDVDADVMLYKDFLLLCEQWIRNMKIDLFELDQ